MKEVLSLQNAILATLTYFDIFDFPLTIAELEDYLYGWHAPAEAIEAVLRDRDSVSHAHGYYFLKGREEIAELRKERRPMLDRLWKRAERFCPLLALSPYIKMVAVVNSVALGNVKETSDIDLFVIADNGRLESARFFMKCIAQAMGMRAHHEKIAGRFCLSFFVTENAMNLRNLAHDFDPHLAYFVKTLTPIFGQAAYKAFIRANSAWTSKYFKRPLSPRLERLQESVPIALGRICLRTLSLSLGSLIESIAGRWQRKRDVLRKKKLSKSHGVVLNADVFKFHENDPREEIAKIFQSRVSLL